MTREFTIDELMTFGYLMYQSGYINGYTKGYKVKRNDTPRKTTKTT